MNYGIPARFVTSLPENAIGKATLAYLKGFGIETSCISLRGDRMGLYFLESGSGPRPSVVIYDRANSAIANAKPTDFNWDAVFERGKWLHISGITPGISQNGADLTLYALREAKKRGLMISFDLNYRKNLWKYGKKVKEVMADLIPLIDVVIANEEDIQNCLGIELDQKIGGTELDRQKYQTLAHLVCEKHPHIQYIAFTLRESYSADHNDWSGLLYSNSERKAYISKTYRLTDIVDRVGGGDSFAGGLIYGLYSKLNPQEIIEFAVAASALKHTIPGDTNRVSLEEVKKLIGGDSSGRVQR
jgi:2-dehydro-3-deoxygluconokinase